MEELFVASPPAATQRSLPNTTDNTVIGIVVAAAVHEFAVSDVPYRIAALAGFTSYSVGHNVGASVFTGGAVRYRIYSGYGLDAVEVAKICFVAGLTFWLGNITVLGFGFAYHPDAASHIDQLPAWFNRGLGITALLVLAPRHPERFAEVIRLCQQEGLKTVRRSTLPIDAEPRADVVVLDTIGELAQLYQIAKTASSTSGSLQTLITNLQSRDTELQQKVDDITSAAATSTTMPPDTLATCMPLMNA